ncbi:MAG TPA: response regulator [Pyrinomonadaceae bacterium]|nr:response regulator [Pyrinomonadaceae bacterium]
MSSRFQYPMNTGSLGDTRRPSTFTPVTHHTASNFAPDQNWTAIKANHRPTVLVVEDNDDSLFMLKSVLSRKGYHVVEAWDGKQAVEIAESEELDLILLDLQLPRLNGLGVIHRLRQNSKLQNVPVVVITGQDPEQYRSSAIAEGCDDFLVKPIDFDRLDAVLDYYAPVEPIAA